MNFFKKKVNSQETSLEKQRKKNGKFSLSVDDLPKNALDLAYVDLMTEYNIEQDYDKKALLQKKLVTLSDIINDKSYTSIGNKNVRDYFINKGQLTEEKWGVMSEQERHELVEIYKKLQDINANLVTKELKFDLEPKVEQEQAKQETKKEKTKKEKKSFSSFFKKKVPSTSVKSSVKEIIEDEVASLKQKKIKDRAKELEEATIKHDRLKLKIPQFGKKEETKAESKINFKSLENIYCVQCKHALKNHQSKGISNGCSCGCLETMESIAESHGIQLHKPTKVLEQILAQEQFDEPTIEQLVEAKAIEPITEEINFDKIEKQAKQFESMIKTAPARVDFKTESSTQILQENKPTHPTQVKTHANICANCDHLLNTHFEDPNNSFCTIVGCTCETFRSYPT